MSLTIAVTPDGVSGQMQMTYDKAQGWYEWSLQAGSTWRQDYLGITD